ncbi:hypothetical protein [Algoriphagus sp.]|uniref:hypothetical protein n=1 Tax=Algoriphagus sp. TaxID=1872435 RepID=UPI00329A3C9B
MENKKILLVIPDGVGIRNYLYSDLISKLKAAGFELTLLHNLDSSLIELVKGKFNVEFDQIPFQSFPESKAQYLLREATSFARLRLSAARVSNPTLLSNSKVGKKGAKGVFFGKITAFIGKSLKSYESILFFESEINRYWNKSKAIGYYHELLKTQRPDLIFITHQRVPSLAPLCLAAKARKIPTISAIYSWDNIPKARLPIRTDFYAVWSDYMKKEFLEFYPEILPQQLAVTGTPQFDFYKNEELIISRNQFAESYGLDAQKKWILFSGDDEVTSPHDPEYLRDLAEALAPYTDIQILFRQVPVEGPERYAAYIETYDTITHIPPLWNKGETWMSFFPLIEDIQLLKNLCFHCETVVNIGSTMALDFAYFNKPGIYLHYDTKLDPNWSTQIIYQFQHFRSMDGLDAVVFVKGKEELAEKILQVIEQPETVAKDRLAWLNRVNDPSPSASDKLLELCEKVVLPQKSTPDENSL